MKNGSKLKELIEAAGLTQREFSADISIAPTTLSGYINSTREPDLATLSLIASRLSVSVDYLMDVCNNNDDVLILTPAEAGFVERLRRMSAVQQDAVQSYMDFLEYKNNK